MVTKEFKIKVINAIAEDRKRFNSDRKHAINLDISASQYSRIQAGDIEQVLSDMKWMSIAARIGISTSEFEWKTAKTPVFNHIYQQLDACKSASWSGILCDMADIGKTYTAKVFVKENRNAYYIDCSLVKTRMKFVRAISRELGLNYRLHLGELFENIASHIQTLHRPIIILDEAGDLDYTAFLELKAFWNATEGCCGWYMMGADGLRAKIERARSGLKVGYDEIFSRFGGRYQRVSPDGKEARDEFKKLQTGLVLKANAPGAKIQEMYAKTDGSLRRIHLEVQKLALKDDIQKEEGKED